MITYYVDSSAVLRKLMNEPFEVWDKWKRGSRIFSSILLRIEVMRVLYREQMLGSYNEEEVISKLIEFQNITPHIDFLNVNNSIAEKAIAPYPSVIKSLDAIHLATALVSKEYIKEEIVFVTHDLKLGQIAKTLGFFVEGI